MPPPSVPAVVPFTLARASDINAISAALAALDAYYASALPTAPVEVFHSILTGTGGVADLVATPASTVTIPLSFGFTGSLLTGEDGGATNANGIGACKIGSNFVYLKVLDAATGLIGFFSDGPMTVPLTVNKNINIALIVHTTLGNLPTDAWTRQLKSDASPLTGSSLNSRLNTIEDGLLGAARPANTYWVSATNGDFTTLGACLTAIGAVTTPTSILVWPGTYTESPATISGPIEIVSMGEVQLNYASGTAALTIPNDGYDHYLANGLKVSNTAGPALAINGRFHSAYNSFSGTTGAIANTTQVVNFSDDNIAGTSGPALSVLAGAYGINLKSTRCIATGTDVIDLTASGAVVEAQSLVIEHSGIGGLNINAVAPAAVIGGPITYTDNFVGISPSVTIGSGASSVASPHGERAFAATLSITVTHNLGYKPMVQVLDSTNSLIIPGSLTHNSNLDFTVAFSTLTAGTILFS